MISELRLKRESFMKALDKKALADDIIATLKNMRVMFIHVGGSVGYGTFLPGKSDLDMNVFVDGFHGAFKCNLPDGDAFIYGREMLKGRFDPNAQLSLYKKCFVDDFLSLPDTLVYLDEAYRKDYEDYRRTDILKTLRGNLANFLEYYRFLYNGASKLPKRFYHVFRVRGQLENWKRTGKYTLDLPKEWYEAEMEFKQAPNALGKSSEWIGRAGKCLDEIEETMEELPDGQP